MSSNDDLLLTLFVNLRNAATTFGKQSTQYQSVYATVYEHLRSMQQSGQKTNLTEAKRMLQETNGLALDFAKLGLDQNTAQ